MIGRIFAGRGHAELAPPAVPAGTRVYAIGDIHGRADLLRTLTLLVHEDAYRRQAPRNVVVYLGDYVDRGPESRGVVELLLREPLPGFERVHLRGNHEDIVLRFLEDVCVRAELARLWRHGDAGRATASPPRRPCRASPSCGARSASSPSGCRAAHLDFLRALRLSHEEGDYVFVHAGVKPGVPLEQQSEHDMLWIRDEFLRSDAAFGRVVVHGHTISPGPEVRRNRIGIDTGAFMSGHLTALVVEGTEWSFLQT